MSIVNEVLRSLLREDTEEIHLKDDPRWKGLFYSSHDRQDPKLLKSLKAFLKENKYARIVLYHGTSAKNEILPYKGLLPTSAKRRKSLQSGSGFVYLAVFPGMAEQFAKIAYPGDDIVVYRVSVPVNMLVADKDQLRNKTMWAHYAGPRDLASSLAVGLGAAVKGSIPPTMISVEKQSSSKIEEAATQQLDIPSFEEVWKDIQNDGDSVDREIEGRADDRENKVRFEDDTHLDPEDEENIEAFQKWILEDLKEDIEYQYDEIVETYKDLDGKSCWREMTLNKSIDPTKHEKIGIYWSVTESAAEAHWGNFKAGMVKVLYQAKVDISIIDWDGTLVARLNPSLGEMEQEVRFVDDKPIFIERVAIRERGKPLHWVEVNDWRKT